MVKKCFKCNKNKPAGNFYLDSKSKSGLSSWCKGCIKKRNSERRDVRSAYNKEWSAKNRKRINKQRRLRADTIDGKFAMYKRSARRKGRRFSLSKEQFAKLVTKKCHYCGDQELDKNLVGIDRIDSSIGYLPENCVPCCERCNKMKMETSFEEFLFRIYKIYKTHYEKKTTQKKEG
jgi:hypothetical protein